MSKRKIITSSKIILSSIIVFFTVILLLSLPVLFNYNSIKDLIEKKVYSEFKINLKILDDISFKIFPKPHYLVKKANLDLNIDDDKSSIIKTNNLKIFIPTKNIYSKSNIKIEGIEIEKANIYYKLEDVLDFRNHLYYKINKPIYIKKSKFFFLDKDSQTILISSIKKINYLINKKSNSKELKIKGNIFDIDFNSIWKRNYDNVKTTSNEINLKNPNLHINNLFTFESSSNFSGKSFINFLNEEINIKYSFNNNKIYIDSANKNKNKNQKIQLNSKVELDPFFFNATVKIDQKNVNFIIDNLLSIIFHLNEKDLGNINGNLTLDINNLKDSIINNGKISFLFKEKKITMQKSLFEIEDIGNLSSNIRYYENKGDLIFSSENVFEIINQKEFSKKFQLNFKSLNNINRIFFTLEKNINNGEISISNIYLNKIDNENSSNEFYIIKNLHILKSVMKGILS